MVYSGIMPQMLPRLGDSVLNGISRDTGSAVLDVKVLVGAGIHPRSGIPLYERERRG